MYKLSKTNRFFSRFEGTRGEKKQIFRTLAQKWQEDYGDPMCIFKKFERDSLQCAEDSNFRMLTCKGTFDFIQRVNF